MPGPCSCLLPCYEARVKELGPENPVVRKQVSILSQTHSSRHSVSFYARDQGLGALETGSGHEAGHLPRGL